MSLVQRKIYGKIIIRTDITVLTGLHIGASDAYSAIGTVDSPIIKCAKDDRPIIPGSSLKGKLRSLIAAVEDTKEEYKTGDNEKIKRIFGSSSPEIRPARLQFSDAYVIDKDIRLSELTEVKFENFINRGNCQATPRQIERVVPGVAFEEVLVYNIDDPNDVKEDLETLKRGFKLLQYDYLGGLGSRGSGRVSFGNFRIEIVEASPISRGEIEALFKEVEESELLHI